MRKPPAFTFLDDTGNPSLADADVACLGVAMDLTASYTKGTWYGPKAAMDASHQIELEVPLFHVSMLDKVSIHNFGILEYPRSSDGMSSEELSNVMADMVQDVRGYTRTALEQKKLLMTFGGDHSIPNGVFEEIAAHVAPKDVTIFHVDAHLDLRKAYHGQKYSHASILRNARDLGFPAIQTGIRDHISTEEVDYIKANDLGKWIYFSPTLPRDFYRDHEKAFRINRVCREENMLWNGTFEDEQLDEICKAITTPYLYITVDCDGIDATEIPGTGTPLPHGLTLRAVEQALYRVLRESRNRDVKLLGFDINEISPMMKSGAETYCSRDTVTPMTEQKAALLAYKILFWNFLPRFTDQ